ncbi:hypothetical protein [Viscerimonas tarda]
MKIKIEREEKIVLLKALKDGFLDTDMIPELKKVLDLAQPARVLTRQEAKEYLNQIENEC